MNAEQITAYLAATNDAKKWKGKLNKQLKRTKRQHASTTSSSDDDSEQPTSEKTTRGALLSLPWNPVLAYLSGV
jgi:hypothetical protein